MRRRRSPGGEEGAVWALLLWCPRAASKACHIPPEEMVLQLRPLDLTPCREEQKKRDRSLLQSFVHICPTARQPPEFRPPPTSLPLSVHCPPPSLHQHQEPRPSVLHALHARIQPCPAPSTPCREEQTRRRTRSTRTQSPPQSPPHPQRPPTTFSFHARSSQLPTNLREAVKNYLADFFR